MGELTEQDFCFFIVCFCGVDFTCEGAEIYFSAVTLDSGFPLSLDFVVFEAFIFRAGFRFCLGTIAEVLRDGGGAEICIAIVEAVAVYVVTEQLLRYINHLVVHPNLFSGSTRPDSLPAGGVRTGRTFGQMPFVFRKAFVILRIDDGELT